MAKAERPESIVARYFECMREERYRDAAELVAPICLRRFVKHEVPRHRRSNYFAGVDTEAELESLSAVELYARYIEAMDPAARCRRQIDRLRSRYPEHEAELLDVRDRQRSTWSFTTLGSVIADGRVLVLFEHSLDVDPDELRWEPTPHVAVLRETPDGWRLAGDPSPYMGIGVMLAPIEVTNAAGETVVLDPYEPE